MGSSLFLPARCAAVQPSLSLPGLSFLARGFPSLWPSTRAAAQCQSVIMGRRRVFILGIGGPSGSGKTTLASRLVSALDSPFDAVSLDAYFMPEKWPKDPEFGFNAELPSGVDFEKAVKLRMGRSTTRCNMASFRFSSFPCCDYLFKVGLTNF